jgi:hypothetical protein
MLGAPLLIDPNGYGHAHHPHPHDRHLLAQIPSRSVAQPFGSDRVVAVEAQAGAYAPFVRERLDAIRGAFGSPAASEAAHTITTASHELWVTLDDLYRIRNRPQQADLAFVFAAAAVAVDPIAGARVPLGAIAGKEQTPGYFSVAERIRDRGHQLAHSGKPWRQAALVERSRADVEEFERMVAMSEVGGSCHRTVE